MAGSKSVNYLGTELDFGCGAGVSTACATVGLTVEKSVLTMETWVR